MSTQYFTSDLHFGHRLVAGLRGFPDTESHDSTIASILLRTVRPQDTVWVLGDLTVNAKLRGYALGIIDSLPGTKHLIAGNHDDCSAIHRNAWKRQAEYLEVFASVQEYAKIRLAGEDVLLSHYPYKGYGVERHDNKYDQWMLQDTGKWLLHGHTHEADRRRVDKMIHVGLDAWVMEPVAQHTIERMITHGED